MTPTLQALNRAKARRRQALEDAPRSLDLWTGRYVADVDLSDLDEEIAALERQLDEETA